MDGQVRTWKESERARGTHSLESADGRTSQDMEGIRASKGHSRPGKHRRMDKSGHRRNTSERGALTNWRVQTDRQVRTRKESEQARGTHFLERADRRTSQDTEGIQVSEGHSRTGEHRWTEKSGKKNINPGMTQKEGRLT